MQMHKISRACANKGAFSQGQPLLSDSDPDLTQINLPRAELQTFLPGKGVFSSAQTALIVNVEDHGACGCTQFSTELSILQAASAEPGKQRESQEFPSASKTWPQEMDHEHWVVKCYLR